MPAVEERGHPAAPGGLHVAEGKLGPDVEVLLSEQEHEPAEVQVRLREEQGSGEEGRCS